MAEIYVGNLGPNITTRDIFSNFEIFGEIRKIKLPRTSKARSYAFVEFKNHDDAIFAIQSWNRKFNWHVELSHNATMLLRAGGVGSNSSSFRQRSWTNCYRCGGYGHFFRNCTSGYGKDMKNKGVKQSQRTRMKKNQIASTTIWKPIRPPTPPWLELPEDITMAILQKLGSTTEILVTAQNVCTAWRKICRDPTMWCAIDMKLNDYHDIRYNRYDIFKINRNAVDLSQGQVTEINIQGFLASVYEYSPPNNVLEYISKRCGNLRCLGITFSGNVHHHGMYIESLKMAVMGFPVLEELHLHFICGDVEMDAFEAISRSCPMLKTFALNSGCDRFNGIRRGNQEALAVATFMPELLHLQLLRSAMSNEGLENILNGCPKLESLDLRGCDNLDLEVAELGKRCAQQIKLLRLPHDRIHDFAWDVYYCTTYYDSMAESDELDYWCNRSYGEPHHQYDEPDNWYDDLSNEWSDDDYYGSLYHGHDFSII